MNIDRINQVLLYTLLLLTTIACTSQDSRLLGTWKVQSPFYQATYEIVPDKIGYTGKIIYYNDGTSQYSSKDQRILFKGLLQQDSIYIDVISGATTANNSSKTICIKIKNQDTLEATTYIMNQSIKELWIKQQ